METTARKAVHTPANQNAKNAPSLNVLGMRTDVKLQHDQTDQQISCIECWLEPRQMGPPPHIHYALDEIMFVTEGTVTLLAGDEVVEVSAGGWHYRPRGIVHTFWNGHDAPRKVCGYIPKHPKFCSLFRRTF